MAWFKWYEGASTDAKIQCVASLCEQPVAFVIALWIMILERASAAENRGSIDGFDCESADVALGMPEGAACRIFEAMKVKGMIEDGQVVHWEKRQAVRKKAGTTQARSNAERQREYRERQKAAQEARNDRNESNETVTQRNDSNALRNVTLHNVTQRNVTVTESNAPFKDKIREEELRDLKTPPIPPQGGTAGEGRADNLPVVRGGVSKPPEQVPKAKRSRGVAELQAIMACFTGNVELLRALEEFRKMRERIRKPLTAHALELLLEKLNGLAGSDVAKIAVVEQSIMNSWQGLFPLKESHGDKPATPTEWQKGKQEQREMAEMILNSRMRREAQNEKAAGRIAVNG